MASRFLKTKGVDGYADMINYRAVTDLGAAIRAACPDGNDIFFDNTGGAIADAAIRSMRLRGRVIQCGTAANASWTPVPTGPRPEREILTRRLRWSGFIIFDHLAEFDSAAAKLAELALAGKIVHDEEILPGLEHAPGAIANSKRLMEELWSTSVRQDIERALRHHMEARESPESKEGITAFNEKRPPNWAV